MKINKKVGLSFLTIAGTLTAVVGITLAQFSDSVTLAGNTLTTASATLGIGSKDCNNAKGAIDGVMTKNVTPGESGTKDFCLKNSSDDPLDVTAVANVTSGELDPSLVDVTIDCGSGPEMVNLNGATSSTIVTIPANSVVHCTIEQTLSGSASSSASNKSISYDVVFTGATSGTD